MESEGVYGTMKELVDRQAIDGELALAFDGQPQPRPVNGYLFADIEADETGKPLKRCERAGLCAYPKEGKGQIILMLLDVNDPEGWAFYTCDGGVVRSWPSADDLKSKFTRLRQYTPAEGTAAARNLATEAGR